MTSLEIVVVILLSLGVVLAMVASIGLLRFPDVLARMHASSKPQSLGMILVLVGLAVGLSAWRDLGMVLLIAIAQLVTVPVASAMVGRAAFRRGLVHPEGYAVDELSPLLAQDGQDDADDQAG
ncbi:monovalent cation/H(+) antiporter subunit G [Devriesea agamarum]|uniref:monovalent cation/H(+) antiporter subunit G n=1 Tax=Devriesea agamarum TaxID=472569 RepID=UPI0009FE3DDE|nr:monovalent cation/H(+) antiporter subunit G [Devriesea agamarum]